MIHFEILPEALQVGESGFARLQWDPRREGLPRAVIVTVGWRTEGRGTPQQGAIWRAQYAPQPGAGPVTFDAEFTIPEEGPVTYAGELIRIIWEVECKLDIPMGRDQIERKAFHVHPRPVP